MAGFSILFCSLWKDLINETFISKKSILKFLSFFSIFIIISIINLPLNLFLNTIFLILSLLCDNNIQLVIEDYDRSFRRSFGFRIRSLSFN